MKNNYLLLALCTLSSQIIQAAATEETKQSIPKHIKLHLNSPDSIILTPGGSYTIEIPLEAPEPITGRTFAQRFQETAAIGLPLVLTHSIHASNLGIKAETFDLCAAIRAHKTWDEHILTPATTVVNCKNIEKSISDAHIAYLRMSLTPQGASYVHACNITGAIGPFYTDMHSAEYTIRSNTKDGGPLILENIDLIKAALLYEFTKDARVPLALHALYKVGIVREDLPDHKEALGRLVKTFKELKEREDEN